MKSRILGLVLALFFKVSWASTFSPVRPPAFPLAVRSPYLSIWLPAGDDPTGNDGPGNGGYLAGEWTQTYWNGNSTTEWAGLIRVDGNVFCWMGSFADITAVTQLSYEYTSTKSIFVMNVDDKVQMTITFLSPITPNDFKRQSLVFSYMNVELESTDGEAHDVELYSDISGQWVSGDPTATLEWKFDTENNDIAYHQIYRQTPLLFSEELNEQTDYGNWYWATSSNAGLTFQSGGNGTVRNQFIENGALANTTDDNFRGWGNDLPVFAFTVGLGPVNAKVDTLFSIGLAQTLAIQFEGADGLVSVPSLWTSYFDSDLAALSFFHGDFATSDELCTVLDNQVAQDSIAAAGEDYAALTSLTVRQVFGATQLCGTADKTYLFLKEMSDNANVQTVDVIFPAHPIFLYLNPELLKLLLDPLFENQEAGLWPEQYALHDLGEYYPNATGHSNSSTAEAQPLEECGNMLIMALAYAQRTGNVSYLTQHYDILKQWTGFLVSEALIPENQKSTDDFQGSLANQTNLALKGIIGIGAMASIANLTGQMQDAANYQNISQSYINEWQILGINQDASPPHTTLAYGENDTYGLLYNLYGDRLLGLNLVPQSVYDMQSDFYPTVVEEYGFRLDTRTPWAKADWQLWTAAIAANTTRQLFIERLASWVNVTTISSPLCDLYNVTDGNFPEYPEVGNLYAYSARPVMGGSFALLALGERPTNIP